ncbi:hypothetical protein [Methylophaga nitratireducenticrescens]|uniref:Uncharacterized protein n=1 Tax=Methylophaga nitratireducenticrescens TaxID=754476 RepID=I1XG45_METNJ|nr:hypothetical protein [Methylophaga nitratireducenticrescens]AFI83364.1 hypothetical protein Q7A_518 [Methylophaga nitratireducenticrescens]AUZ83481.1 hypothetical protein CDW43_02340 [Methylophaga nitratireducenticrescens]
MAIGFFQKRIEEIIDNVANSDDTTSLTAEQLSQLSSELALYFSTILLTLAGALLIAFFVLWILKRRANPTTTANKELERQRVLQELESQFLAISNQPAVWLTNRSNFDAKLVYEFSLALTPEVRWQVPQTVETSWHMGDRLITITDQQDLLTASLLDEILFWFRRLDRSVAGEIIKVEDIYSLWRQILPFAIDNRFSFMAAYFAEDKRGSLNDIEAVRQVLIGVIRYCQQQKHSQPLSYINGRLDPLFFEQLPKGMKTGIEAARQNTVRKDPVVMDEVSAPIQQNRSERKEPVVTAPENVTETSEKTTRKEPIVSFDNVDAETKKPE